MKKRFKNILAKKRKKNGISILACAVVLTISLGTLVGCQVVKEEVKGVVGESGKKDAEPKQMSAEKPSAESIALDEKAMLTFTKEGETEQKQAALVTGDGYFLYLPENEWQKTDSDVWTAAVNEQVRIWVTHYEETALSEVEKRVAADAYAAMQSHSSGKQEGELAYNVRLHEFENDVWAVYYCYPAEAEEGWGRELPVIADTFAVSASEENAPAIVYSGGDSGAYLGDADCQEISSIVDEFAEAYFSGDAGSIPKFLADTYEGNISVYESAGAVSDLNLKGLSDTDEKKAKDGEYTVSLEFRDSSYEDMFLYLAVGFIKQEEGWKIQFYGVEG